MILEYILDHSLMLSILLMLLFYYVLILMTTLVLILLVYSHKTFLLLSISR